jgi:hypothetical protein
MGNIVCIDSKSHGKEMIKMNILRDLFAGTSIFTTPLSAGLLRFGWTVALAASTPTWSSVLVFNSFVSSLKLKFFI